jgi:surfeit locus 1 family protein
MNGDPPRARRPKWLPAVAAFVTAALCIAAGNWQHRRMLEKEALQASITRAATAAPVALPAGVEDWNAWRFRRVMASGEYDAAHQILIDNKVRRGEAGFDVVTPLRMRDGRSVLVDRGWIRIGASRAMLPQPAPPAGSVTVDGRIDVPPRNYFELGDGSAPSGPLWEHLDPLRYAKATGIDVLPIVIEATQAGGGAGLVRDFPLPDTGIERHLSYMVQWYTFAAMAVGLWAWFALVRPHLARRMHVAG